MPRVYLFLSIVITCFMTGCSGPYISKYYEFTTLDGFAEQTQRMAGPEYVSWYENKTILSVALGKNAEYLLQRARNAMEHICKQQAGGSRLSNKPEYALYDGGIKISPGEFIFERALLVSSLMNKESRFKMSSFLDSSEVLSPGEYFYCFSYRNQNSFLRSVNEKNLMEISLGFKFISEFDSENNFLGNYLIAMNGTAFESFLSDYESYALDVTRQKTQKIQEKQRQEESEYRTKMARFEDSAGVPKQIGQSVCSRDNFLGNVELISGDKIKVSVVGRVTGESDYYFFDSSGSAKNFTLSSVTRSVVWEDKSEWAACNFAVDKN